MNHKPVEAVINPHGKHFVGDGFFVHNIIPGTQGLSMARMSPFIMMDYNAPHVFPPSDKPRGVDVHPHRGFETVTIAYKGKVEHHDSSGGGGIIEEGDVQWMTAASGVLHKEFHETQWSKQGGLFQMVQLWVNLPSKFKMSPPKYQALPNHGLGKISLDNDAVLIEVIAGETHGVKGPAETFTPVHLYNVKMKAGSNVSFEFPVHFTTAVLMLEGTSMVNGAEAAPNHFVLLRNEGTSISIQAKSDAIVLVLSGEPINEPIAHYGPFVMNSREEIMQAIDDFNAGKFGQLD